MTMNLSGREPTEADGDCLHSARLRNVFGHFPTGVTVISAVAEGRPVGMACNSFASASLDPPLVTFAVGRESETWPLLQAAGSFAINFLSSHQHELGRSFASRGVDRFVDVSWHRSPAGSPLIDDALAWLDCDLERVYEAGDHELVLARVRWLETSERDQPLVFFRGVFTHLHGGLHQP